MTSRSRASQALHIALEEILVCPGCLAAQWQLTEADVSCRACHRTYPLVEGIPVLLPDAPSAQESERQFRNRIARESMQQDHLSIDEIAGPYHCLPVMRARARRFRRQFAPQDWILDIGVGTGWPWSDLPPGARILGVDMSLGNLLVGRRLFGDYQQNVVLVCADASRLPVRDHAMAGVWSVQAFQHFPDVVLVGAQTELARVLRERYVMEIYSFMPALALRLIGRLKGHPLQRQGQWGEMELRRLPPRAWAEVWRNFRNGTTHITHGYSELFFHPSLGWQPRRYPLALEQCLATCLPWLAGLFAHQAHVRIEGRIPLIRTVIP